MIHGRGNRLGVVSSYFDDVSFLGVEYVRSRDVSVTRMHSDRNIYNMSKDRCRRARSLTKSSAQLLQTLR